MNDAGTRRLFGRAVLAAWRQLCYKLTYHRFLSISLKHWIWALIVLPPLVAWFGRIEWVWAILLAVLGAAALIGAERARRKQYVLFLPTESSERHSERPLDVDEPLRCWASGLLGVEGKGRALACERASISFVRTREHVLMAQVRRTRFLLLAVVSKADVGYWYAFFHPRQVQTMRVGTLYCGFSARPGLELRYAGEEAGQSVQLYLAFEDLIARQRLMDNLRQDVRKEAF